MHKSLVVPMVSKKPRLFPQVNASAAGRLSLLACTLALTACASTAPMVQSEPGVNKSPGVHDMIVQSAARVDAVKARMASSKKPADFTGPRMDVIWVGDAHEIVRQIAAQRKLEYVETGPKPYLDLPVYVKIYNVTLEEALKEIDGQNPTKANIKHYNNKIVVEMKPY